MTDTYGSHKLTSYDSTERYPRSVITFKSDKQKSALHPTQKPVALMEYLVETYSKKGDLILDPFLGSGTTAIACKKLGRYRIGIELSQKFCEISIKRLQAFKNS